MSTYEIVYSDGHTSRMRLNDAVSASDEVAKWPPEKRATVVEIRPVTEFEARPFTGKPQRSAVVALAASGAIDSDVKEIMIGLAETVSATRLEAEAAQQQYHARIAALEADIAALKGAV